jgi:hypothetical protein
VKQFGWNRGRRLMRIAMGPMLAGMLGVAGCDSSRQGTVQLTPETRQRLLPHASGRSKTGKGPAVSGKTFSIKERNRERASPP